MASNREETLLASLATDISYGYTESANTEPVGPHFLRITDIQNGVVDWESVPYCTIHEAKLDDYRLAHGDIVVARTGNSTGENYIFSGEREAVFASYLIRFRIDPKRADPFFVWYSMRSQKWWDFVSSSKTGSAQAGANAKVLGRYPISLPSLPEQKAIAHILGTLDDKIELNRKMNETLEAMARAIFKSWFVDFDPVRIKAEAKVQGRSPDAELQQLGLSREIADLFPDEFQDSELGKIPKGFGCHRLRDIAAIDRGLSYKGKYLDPDGIPMLNLGCFAGKGIIREEKIKGYSGEFKERHVVHAGDVLLANTDMTQNRTILGSPISVPDSTPPDGCLFSHHVYALRFPDEQSRKWRDYLFYAFLQQDFRERAENFATGTTVLAMPKDAVLDHDLVLPPDNLLNAFLSVVTPLRSMLGTNTRESISLAETREVLLPRLLSGQVQLGDTQKMAEENV